jgi:hypothetical protein
MRITLGQSGGAAPGSMGPVDGCLQNTSEGLYYIPTGSDPVGYFNAAAPMCYSDVTPTPPAPAVTPAEPPPTLPQLPVVTPLNISQPLPALTSSTLQPAPPETQDLWCQLNQWIGEYPLLAGAALALTAWLVWPKGAR